MLYKLAESRVSRPLKIGWKTRVGMALILLATACGSLPKFESKPRQDVLFKENDTKVSIVLPAHSDGKPANVGDAVGKIDKSLRMTRNQQLADPNSCVNDFIRANIGKVNLPYVYDLETGTFTDTPNPYFDGDPDVTATWGLPGGDETYADTYNLPPTVACKIVDVNPAGQLVP